MLAMVLFILIAVSSFGQNQSKFDEDYFSFFPSYEELIEVYFSSNEFDYASITKTKFAKKVDGWYVIFLDDKFEESEERRIWDAETAMFTNIKNDALKDGGYESIERGKQHFLRGYATMWFEQYPVYGYHGYENDVIQLLADEEDLSAGYLDALARSYSSKSMETINPGQFGGKKKVMEYDRTLNPKDWDEAILDKFMMYADKSIETFEKLSNKYPNYQTVVGNIRTKYRNEFMAPYYALKFSGKPELAKKYLVDDLYTDFQIQTATNYLESCANNAILFTGGDNDTYPLIYVQDKLGIRPDVKVINTSLASLGRYIHFIKTTYNLPTTLDTDAYKLDNIEFFMVKKEMEDVDLRDYFKTLSEDEDIYVDEDGHRFLPSNQGFWVVQPKPLGLQLGVAKRLTESAVRFSINKNYLTKGEIFILDLVTTDNWQTPVYFANGSAFFAQSLGMFDYLKVEGLAYRFLPKGTHEANALETNLLKRFEYRGMNGTDWFSGENAITLYFYQLAFKELFDSRQNNPQKIEALCDELETIFPHKAVSYKSFAADFADYCYFNDLTERGDAFIRNEVQHIHAYFSGLGDKEELSFFERQMVQRMLFTASRLTTIAETNEREAFANLSEELQVYWEKYEE